MKKCNVLSRAAGLTGLKIREKKPQIFLIFGLVSMGGAIVSAVCAARKHDEIVEDHLKRLELAKAQYVVVEAMDGSSLDDSSGADDQNEAGDVVRERSAKEIRRDVTKCYLLTGCKMAKNYSLTAGLAVLAGMFFVTGHNEQAQTIVGLTGAYMGLKEYTDQYEKRNIELNGIENHNMCKYGYKEIEIEEEDPDNGEVTTSKVKVPLEGNDIVDNTVFRDQIIVIDRHTSCEYKGVASLDQMWLNAVENYLNDLLNTREWVVVNDVLDELKVERTDEGRDIGWVKGCGERISLGYNTTMKGLNSRFLNGYNDEPIILELNVHGNVNWLRKHRAEMLKEGSKEAKA